MTRFPEILLFAQNYFVVKKFRLDLIKQLSLNYIVRVVTITDEMANYDGQVLGNNIEVYVSNSSRKTHGLTRLMKLFYAYVPIRHKPSSLIMCFGLLPIVVGWIVSIVKIGQVQRISVITGFGSYFYNKSILISWVTKKIYAVALKRSSQIWVASNSDKKKLISLVGKFSNVKVFYGAGISLSMLDRNLPINLSSIKFIGRIRVDKGILDFILASKNKRHAGLEFSVYGIMDPADDYANQEVKMAINDGLIKYHGFIKFRDDLYLDRGIVVHPSMHEGLPTVIVESLATKSPVISSNIDVVNELKSMGFAIFTYGQSCEYATINDAIDAIYSLSVGELNGLLERNARLANLFFNTEILAKRQVEFVNELFV